MPLRLLLPLFAALLLAACADKEPHVFPATPMRIGVAPFTQPADTGDLLAGYMPDNVSRVEQKVFPMLDNDFADLLAAMTARAYIGLDVAGECLQQHPKQAGAGAFEYWLAIGECMNAQLLIVPQVQNWQEREGGEMGVVNPAAVSVDIFLLDIQNRSLMTRSRYDEKQRALLDNIMDVGKFVKRSGRWVDAATLAKEGMYKAIKDFGL